MNRKNNNTAAKVQKVDRGQARDSCLRRPVCVQRTGRGFGRQVGGALGFGALHVLILALLAAFAISTAGTAFAQGEIDESQLIDKGRNYVRHRNPDFVG